MSVSIHNNLVWKYFQRNQRLRNVVASLARLNASLREASIQLLVSLPDRIANALELNVEFVTKYLIIIIRSLISKNKWKYMHTIKRSSHSAWHFRDAFTPSHYFQCLASDVFSGTMLAVVRGDEQVQ